MIFIIQLKHSRLELRKFIYLAAGKIMFEHHDIQAKVKHSNFSIYPLY